MRGRDKNQPIAQSRPRRRLFALLAIAVVCVVGLFIYSLARSKSSDSTATEREQRIGESGKLPPDEITSSVSVVELAQHNRTQTAVEKLALKQDASNDDWDTEVLSDAASEQLTNMQMLLENPDRIESQS